MKATPEATADEARRECPFCAEPIKIAAKICPHCQSRLVRHGLLRQELLAGVPLVVMIVLFAAFSYWAERLTAPKPGRNTTAYRQELQVNRVQLSAPDHRSAAVLTGWITNQGTRFWRVHSLEVRFLNPDGSLLDVREPTMPESFVAPPGEETAFRVALKGLPEAVLAARIQARVNEASVGQSRRPRDD
jgi:hypothetical protein